MDAELITQKSTPSDLWHDSLEQPRRRKPVRKRKRRPVAASNEDLPQPERFQLPEEESRQFEVNYEPLDTTDMPRRRRKKPQYRRHRWTEDYVDIERPARRRLQRRKRPTIDTYPEFSEFDHYKPDDKSSNIPKHGVNEPIPNNNNNHEHFSDNAESYVEQAPENKTDAVHPDSFPSIPSDADLSYKEDKSLSEFSMEAISPDKHVEIGDQEEKLQYKIEEKSSMIKEFVKAQDKYANLHSSKLKLNINDEKNKVESSTVMDYNLKEVKKMQKLDEKLNSYNLNNTHLVALLEHISDSDQHLKYKDKVLASASNTNRYLNDSESLFMDELKLGTPIDPLTLRDILKRSNGTSLSEILQQHNLSLTDLLNGREQALSVLKSNDLESAQQRNIPSEQDQINNNPDNEQLQEEIVSAPIDLQPDTETTSDVVSTENTGIIDHSASTTDHSLSEKKQESMPKILPKSRFPGAVRRKLRMRPTVNSTFKGQLNRDLIALTARRYFNHSRNGLKAKEWKNIVPSMMHTTDSNEPSSNKDEPRDLATTSTTMSTVEETTILEKSYTYPSTVSTWTEKSTQADEDEHEGTETTPYTQRETTTERLTTETIKTTSEKPKVTRKVKFGLPNLGLRQQAFNNRLKRKRMKQKNSTTESSQGDHMQDLFGIPNLVSSSEFIEKTQTTKKIVPQKLDEFTFLEDFMTTESAIRTENHKSTVSDSRTSDNFEKYDILSTTEETAKIEIEEILNDTRASSRLSRILMERNMTLGELIEHRERGSSHVHLADIFHNTSREPNPPEPFLSKSLIEPISKETYPLRAILEANSHESTAKATTMDPSVMETQFVNIPIMMDFGNNVNENGENMGIMSLFNKITENDISLESSSIRKDSEGTPYITTVITVDTTENNNTREGRVIKNDFEKLNNEDSWTSLFSLVKNYRNDTKAIKDSPVLTPNKNIILEQDIDGDGVIVLEDLQHLKNFDSHIASASDDHFEVSTHMMSEASTVPTPVVDQVSSNTRSITAITASIVGLALVLFLLTYTAFKWFHQNNALPDKENTKEEIPTPVFESRKTLKNNCSTRSISPMLTNSNIYTINTLDSHAGLDTPDYMWDSLRKPFQ